MPGRYSCVQLFVTLRIVACQAPLSVGFSSKEYWSGLLCPSFRRPSQQRSNPHLLNLLHCTNHYFSNSIDEKSSHLKEPDSNSIDEKSSHLKEPDKFCDLAKLTWLGWEGEARFKNEETYVYLRVTRVDIWQKPT